MAAMGRAMSQKLTKAPPSATTSTAPAITNWAAAEAVSVCARRSEPAWISRYFSINASIRAALSPRPVMLRSTRVSVCSSERQKGMKPFRILCRSS